MRIIKLSLKSHKSQFLSLLIRNRVHKYNIKPVKVSFIKLEQTPNA